jgi:hypothetical protein
MDRFRPLIPPLFVSLTLGLAPFFPEPHIVGKVRWVLGGAKGMAALDWGDLLMHGAPWLWLLGTLFWTLRPGAASSTPGESPPRA